MKSTIKFQVLALLIVLCASVTLKAITYEPLPNDPDTYGFFYKLDMARFPQLLLSNMPYEVLQGYIVADSIVRVLPSFSYRWNPINDLNLHSDTMHYLYKYLYIMSDYDPERYFAFSCRKYPDAKNYPNMMLNDL